MAMIGKKARSAAALFMAAHFPTNGFTTETQRTQRRLCALFVSVVIFMFATSLSAQGPDANWRTITTAHFRIHYPAEYEAWTKRAASDIESVREAVVHEVGFSPEQVTDIVVKNPIAEANGVTLPLLDHPRIVLYTEPPEPEGQLGEFHNWIDLLTVHEMTHLVHLLRPSRNPTQRLLAHLLPLNPITLSGSFVGTYCALIRRLNVTEAATTLVGFSPPVMSIMI